jgi:hypothetical protein
LKTPQPVLPQFHSQFLSCFWRQILEEDIIETAIPSGFLAGIGCAMLYPSKSLTIYILWKTLEVYNYYFYDLLLNFIQVSFFMSFIFVAFHFR